MDRLVSHPTISEIPLSDRGKDYSDCSIPAYMQEVYHWAYLDSRNALLLDHEWVVNLILWGNSPALRESVLKEIEPASQVFQAAHVYGRMQPDLARKIGPEGSLDVVDVAVAGRTVPTQAELLQQCPSAYR